MGVAQVRAAMSRAGQVALVTGSSQGLGSTIAARLAAERAAVAVNSIDAEAAEAYAGKLVASGARAISAPADVADRDAVDEMIGRIERDLGEIDVLVNNAAYLKMTLLSEEVDDEWERMLAVNLLGPVHCSERAMPAMVARGSGRIVNIASTWGLIGARGASAYCASKGGLIGYTAALGEGLERTGVTVAAVAPGYMDTPQLDADADFGGYSAEEIRARYARFSLAARVGRPEEIAVVVSFLASAGGDAFNGQTLVVSGGRGE